MRVPADIYTINWLRVPADVYTINGLW
jgi:hypothetical protein